MSGLSNSPSGSGGRACGTRFARMLRCVETRGSAAACSVEVDAFLACERAVFQAAVRRGEKDRRVYGPNSDGEGDQDISNDKSSSGNAREHRRTARENALARVVGQYPRREPRHFTSDEKDDMMSIEDDDLSGDRDGRRGFQHRAVTEINAFRELIMRAATTQARACQSLRETCMNEEMPGKIRERCMRIAYDGAESANAIATFCRRGLSSLAETLKTKLNDWRDNSKE